MKDKLIGFVFGFDACLFLCIGYCLVQIRLNQYRKCVNCKKRYMQKDSECKKYKTMFCSDFCERAYTMDYLIQNGCTIEQAVIVASLDEKQKSDSTSN